MSWTKRSQETLYRDFTEKAASESQSIIEKPWSLEVWDISEGKMKTFISVKEETNNMLDGQLHEYVQNTVRRLNGRPQLRIVFVPSDVPRRETKGLMVELFHKFGIPHDFTAERVLSINHSFSRRSAENNGFSSWLRFSYISIASARTDDESPDGEDDATENSMIADKYPERESSFFLQASADTSVTLVCFDAGPSVKRRMYDLMKSRGWNDVATNPQILFDVTLEGLHEEVDDTARRMEEEFEPLEKVCTRFQLLYIYYILRWQTSDVNLTKQSIIRLAGSDDMISSPRTQHEELYMFARHATDLSRVLESALMINEGILMNASVSIPSTTSMDNPPCPSNNISSNRRSLVDLQLKECLEYRRTLFRSTQLRLSHFQKRIEAATALASNLASQQQSAAAIQGPVSMKLIAASILIFLPTITVATIAGSGLLLSEQLDEEGSWDVSATPLFYLLWYISVPLTLVLVLLSLCWLWWRRGKSGKMAQSSSWFQKAMIWRRHTKDKKGHDEESSMPV
ncbi:hypothetical protein CFAM422_001136 [Trichoderma lentiforme]|uniref:Uncharacterized protein n=1 Tax=Trichoderma lentiforme TaxID=1567552 RepID=A0A9P4XP15_9HYPO|nr:hypothetical protein CFAM422_001136 [Trichoderma lentiforme]